MFNIVLFNPQIPPNTGNIGRLCVNAGSKLHIVKPIGFDINEKAVKRAGLDFWDKLDLTIWESTEEFLKNVDTSRCFFATTKTKTPYFQKEFKKIFKGFPKRTHYRISGKRRRIKKILRTI